MLNSYDCLIKNARIASMQNNAKPYGELAETCVAIKDGKIAKIADSQLLSAPCDKVFDAQQRWLLPGLIDCHTHLVYGGNRANEFEMRLQGKSYKEIAEQGGGIKSTVQATRLESESTLLQSAMKRAARLAEEGVTCLEIKSGYGLDVETELKMLRVAKQLAQHLPLHVETTYLGAHALPIEYQNDADGYIDLVCQRVMPLVAEQKLASCVDVFCESIGFSPEQCERVFKAAKQCGLNVKAHVEQLSDLKGAKLAAAYGALSVDHVEYVAAQDIEHIKQSGTVAVLLPGAFYSLNETQKPPVAAFREHSVPMAVATDLNPGSSPIASLLTCLNMACVLFSLTPEEALQGVTVNAAKALGIQQKGQIAVGMDADLTLWDVQQPAELAYGINQVRPCAKWVAGNEY